MFHVLRVIGILVLLALENLALNLLASWLYDWHRSRKRKPDQQA